ncbi:hypothetical protein D3C85_1943630 [compost metagenome]
MVGDVVACGKFAEPVPFAILPVNVPLNLLSNDKLKFTALGDKRVKKLAAEFEAAIG